MLQFSPEKRTSAEECLKNKIFDPIRVELLEKPSPYKIDCKIDKMDLFDYDLLEQEGLYLKSSYCKEILK